MCISGSVFRRGRHCITTAQSHNIEEHVTKAEGDLAKLEGLEVSLAMRQVDLQHATTEYLKCVEDARFIEAA